MATWLLKSDPEHYSYADLERDRKTVWDGVSNPLALQNLRRARRGDRALIYHTGGEKAVVGIAEIASDPYPDPKRKDPRFAVVDVAAHERLKRPVRLDEIKRHPALRHFDLVRLPRLSVMPVSDEQWTTILALANS
jgi:predicted RNA-binding protein with PUA-like domain